MKIIELVSEWLFNTVVLWWAFGYGFPRLAEIKDRIYNGNGRPPGVA